MHTTQARTSLKITRAQLAHSRAEVRRLTEHAEQLRRELAAARTDPLTGLPTRAAWLNQAARALAGPKQDDQHTLVLLLDLTRFKAVNDNYGHVAGDALLQAQAARLALWARDRGVCGRLGGDELVALVTLDPEDVNHELDHLGTVMSKPMLWDSHRITAPAAIGVAHALDRSLEVLLAAADRAMYRAKAGHLHAWWWRDAEPEDYAAPSAAPVHRVRHSGVLTAQH